MRSDSSDVDGNKRANSTSPLRKALAMADTSNYSDSRDEKHEMSHSPATRDLFSKKTENNDERNH